MLEVVVAETGDVGSRWGRVRPKGAAYVAGSEMPNKEGWRRVSHTRERHVGWLCVLHAHVVSDFDEAVIRLSRNAHSRKYTWTCKM